MKGNNGKSEWENESDRLKREKKKKGYYAIVFHVTAVITWAWHCLLVIAYHFFNCHVENQKWRSEERRVGKEC